MDDDGRSRAALRGDFVFVGPAPVVGHRFSLEHFLVELGRIFRIRDRRIADQHENGFAANIDIFEIVPAVFRRNYAVADEHEIGIVDLDLALQPGRRGDEVIGEFQIHRRLVCDREGQMWLARDAGKRNFLRVTAVRVSRL